MRPLLLDLFCCAGGAAKGYHDAGFDVVGVDNRPQKRYPFKFIQADALEYCREHGHKFAAIHGSPPCQKYSRTKSLKGNRGGHPDLVAPTRNAMIRTGRPYIIENVVGAPLINPILLCGTMFGLGVIRHRLFEMSDQFLLFTPCCNHDGLTLPIWGGSKMAFYKAGKVAKYYSVSGHSFPTGLAREAMGIDWMTRDELSQAIPPAYTEYIGEELLRYLNHS